MFNDELKSRFTAVGHADFWRKHILPTKRFPGLVDNAMRTVAAFGFTYCCEQLFSRMKLTKSKSRAQLTDGHLNDVLLLSVLSVAPDISSLSAQKQHQVSYRLISNCKLCFFIVINVLPGCGRPRSFDFSFCCTLASKGWPPLFLFYILKMPKVLVRANSKSLQYKRDLPNEFHANPMGDLFCILCCQTVNCEKPFRVESYQSSVKHKRLLSTTVHTAEKRQQTFIPILEKIFKSKLVEAFLAVDIPLFKLQHPQIRQLFTHLGQPVSSESSCHEHVDKLAVDEKQRLKERLYNKNAFLVVDESEINGSKYLNILIGDRAVPETTYVLDCSIVETVNQQVMTVKIDDALKKLDIQRHNFVLLLFDAARYITACTAALKLLHSRLFHVTCMGRIFCTTALRKCVATSNKLTISLQKSRL